MTHSFLSPSRALSGLRMFCGPDSVIGRDKQAGLLRDTAEAGYTNPYDDKHREDRKRRIRTLLLGTGGVMLGGLLGHPAGETSGGVIGAGLGGLLGGSLGYSWKYNDFDYTHQK